ncbi:MAG: DUF4160 domain-containing protein [Ferruginibacter sp.]|nr:DUF4160 domain-containing protein [Ferruginibacter sp.]
MNCKCARLFSYSNENKKPAYIHTKKGGADGKIWLLPNLKIAYRHGFSSSGAKEIEEIALKNIDFLIKKWNDYFRK